MKTYLVEKWSGYDHVTTLRVFALQLSRNMNTHWPVKITADILVQTSGDETCGEDLAIAQRAEVRQTEHSAPHSCSPPPQQIFWFFTNTKKRNNMAKGAPGSLSLTSRKTRSKTRKQCFQVLFGGELELSQRASELRQRFLDDNPDVAAAWVEKRKNKLERGKKKDATTEKDPTAFVKFQSQVLDAAWAAATDEQKAKAEELYLAQDKEKPDDTAVEGEAAQLQTERRK
jgi:hypothetical protein